MRRVKSQIKIRKSWGQFRPTERLHGDGKRGGYNRNREKQQWKKEQ
jgi:hypothetical protein